MGEYGLIELKSPESMKPKSVNGSILQLIYYN